ncbi:MAG: NAD-binding protein, partial [Pseudomonadota bacterium]
MRVLICGAGQVGFGIAERLSGEGHDVSVIDLSSRLIANVRDQLDVRGVYGGLLVQTPDLEADELATAQCVTKIKPSDE